MISVPTDSSKTVYDEVTVEYTFEIRMEPCQISDFFDQPMATGITYLVGESTAIFGDYGWVQDPNCGYPENPSVTGVPTAFIDHSSAG